MDNIILIITLGIFNFICFSVVAYFLYKAFISINLNKNKIKTFHVNLEVLLDGNFNLNQKTKDLAYNYASLVQTTSKHQLNTLHAQNEQKMYKQAKQLNQMGAYSDEIKNSCNLSQMEMELIEALGNKEDPVYEVSDSKKLK